MDSLNKFVICPCCGQWLEIQDIGFYTYAFPTPLNTQDIVNGYSQEDFIFNSQSTQCILNKEQSNDN